MFRRTIITTAWLAAAMLCANPLFAQTHGAHVTPPPASHPQPVSHVEHTTTNGATRDGGKATTPHMTFVQRIDANAQLVSRLQPLLPSGMTLDQAAAGFKNQGQFIAALHVSKNLNIPFDQLKAEMTGTEHDSLGHAIHDLKPAADAKAETQKAAQEAKADVKATRPTHAPDTDQDADTAK